VQLGLLPRRLPQLPGWELAAAWQPAREVSGDFYDFIALPDEAAPRWGVVLADVSGKGMPAALFMALARSTVRASLTSLPAVGARVIPAEESAEVTEQIIAQIETEARYAGYVKRQQEEIVRARASQEVSLPPDLDYAAIHGLSHEIRQKLDRHRPATVGQASRISGVTPVAVSLLLVHLKKRRPRR
jgi:hypothetical protein